MKTATLHFCYCGSYMNSTSRLFHKCLMWVQKADHFYDRK